jgi:hypothetical protein
LLEAELNSQLVLVYTRNHHEPPLPIASSKLPPIPVLLLPRPHRHLPTRNRHKDCRTPTPIHHPHSNPRHNLKEVIRARHRNHAEDATLWNASLRSTCTAQTHERDVRTQIPQFANHKQQDREGIPPAIRRWVRCRTIDAGGVSAQSDVEAAEDPVVSGVLEDVEEGHGCIGEAVDEEGFEFALGEVQDDEDHGEELGGGGRGDVDAVVVVEVWADQVDEGVDEEGAEVLDEEDGAPGYLGAWVGVSCVGDEREGAAYRDLSPGWSRLRRARCPQSSHSAYWECTLHRCLL